MSDIEYACQLQRDICEYERFCGDLLIALLKREHRLQVRHKLPSGDDLFDAIWSEVDKLLEEVAVARDLKEER